MPTLEALEDLCDTIGVTLVLHPALRAAIVADERAFCASAIRYLRGRGGDAWSLPLGQGDHATLLFSRRLSSGGCGLLRVEVAEANSLDRIRRSLREADLPPMNDRGRDPARPQ